MSRGLGDVYKRQVNTLTFYDPGLMIMNTYRLDRAVPNTFVTIFTTDFFKLKD